MKNSGGKPRAGAVRKSKKGATVGTGGHGRKALEGRGPTPKAEDRDYHPAGKAKALRERAPAKAAQRGGRDAAPRGASGASRRAKTGDESEIVTGRNSVVEALRAHIP
ncbi:MAG: 23S rRNA (guanosine(2251)-2'-O)-methyltransferase RlmB, partial [Leifsonia sp.]|nr:23S rRNA (guanosine(2251)-2'-O)-methyltransferase RlmB [Leifsonia sp.]